MDIKRVKISELPQADTLKGLYTIGTDKANRSVKVSLEFIKDKTEEVAAALNNIKSTYQAIADEADVSELLNNLT